VKRRPNLVRAVRASLKDCQILDRDGAAVALVLRYALVIDESAALVSELATSHADAVAAGDDNAAANLARLRARVEEAQIIDQLGPKLLSALAALAMTPVSRAAGTRGGISGVQTPAAAALDRLRAVRGQATAGRQH
jgi:hypothetical protein